MHLVKPSTNHAISGIFHFSTIFPVSAFFLTIDNTSLSNSVCVLTPGPGLFMSQISQGEHACTRFRMNVVKTDVVILPHVSYFFYSLPHRKCRDRFATLQPSAGNFEVIYIQFSRVVNYYSDGVGPGMRIHARCAG